MCTGSLQEEGDSRAGIKIAHIKPWASKERKTLSKQHKHILEASGFRQIQDTDPPQGQQCPAALQHPTKRTLWPILGDYNLVETMWLSSSRAGEKRNGQACWCNIFQLCSACCRPLCEPRAWWNKIHGLGTHYCSVEKLASERQHRPQGHGKIFRQAKFQSRGEAFRSFRSVSSIFWWRRHV